MSEYFKSLSEEARKRYLTKLECVGLGINNDPYLPENDSKFNYNMSNWPSLEFGHIFTYYITRPGTFTQEELMSWKQMEAYNYFKSGHVRTVYCCVFGSGGGRCILLKALVNPSQKAPEKANHALVITKPDGTIVCGHCTCMAGLGESCSHVAAILFKIDSAVRLGYTSVTSQHCKWNETFSSKIAPSIVADIDFHRPKRKIEENDTSSRPIKRNPSPILNANHEQKLISRIKTVLPKAVVLSSVMPIVISKKSIIRKLPQVLTSLKNREHLLLNEAELKQLCEKTFQELSISSEQSAYLEESTHLQSQTPLWFEHRSGRITASKFRTVRFTSLSSPSVSLLTNLINNQRFSSTTVPALKLGVDNESIARASYLIAVSNTHSNLQYRPAGLHINTDYPHLGASPDGIIECDCCGEGLIEIKCPYKYRDIDPNMVTDPSFYLKRNAEGEIVGLYYNHDYFYQVQGQLSICSKDYCDFVVWTPKGLYIERIVRDESFFDELKPYLDAYFIRLILPALLTGRIDAVQSSPCVSRNATQPKVFCKCGGKDVGRMIACDNDICPIEWFHYKCVGISRKPKGKWFCSTNCKKSTC